ncbi:MAG TPA: hypothetical protein VND92_04990 [Vicinamibacterales bacterium]|nr:hypothetical protein [Vicinamibacterales bacterium]
MPSAGPSTATVSPEPGASRAGVRFRMPHALVMMLLIIVASVALTWVVPSGTYQRQAGGLVVPGTYHGVSKDYAGSLLHPAGGAAVVAYPASPLAIVSAVPRGMVQTAPLIFMILFIGGMFGVLEETGALGAGIERLLAMTRGNVYVLAPLLMLVLASGSTFLGLISEYLVVIPIVVVLAERLDLDALFATALVTIAAKIGYMTSVTNPLAVVVAQRIVGVPLFTGAGFRLITFVLYLAIGIAYLLRYVRRTTKGRRAEVTFSDARLSRRHVAILLVLLASILVMVYGAQQLHWKDNDLAAMYLFMGLAIAAVGGLGSRAAAQGFLKGMQTMVLAAVLVGLAAAVEVILKDGMILDSIIAFLTRMAQGKPPVVVAQMMVFIEMIIDVFIPSTSGKAAVTMPILGPIGQLSGLGGAITVQAFIFGNGLTNAITPTSGMLLAYLATGKVSYGEWARFVLPLLAILTVLSLLFISGAVLVGY